MRTLAEYDHAGQRLPDASPYYLKDFPLTRRVLDEQITVVVNVDGTDGDPAEVAELRREGDRSLLMAPLVVQGQTIGLLEVIDQRCSREYSRQELRLAGAVAGQAAVAIQNAKLFAERRRSDEDIAALRGALRRLTAHVPRATGGERRADVLSAVAKGVCDAMGAISCVATRERRERRGLRRRPPRRPRRPGRRRHGRGQHRRGPRPVRRQRPHASRDPAPAARGRAAGTAGPQWPPSRPP